MSAPFGHVGQMQQQHNVGGGRGPSSQSELGPSGLALLVPAFALKFQQLMATGHLQLGFSVYIYICIRILPKARVHVYMDIIYCISNRSNRLKRLLGHGDKPAKGRRRWRSSSRTASTTSRRTDIPCAEFVRKEQNGDHAAKRRWSQSFFRTQTMNNLIPKFRNLIPEHVGRALMFVRGADGQRGAVVEKSWLRARLGHAGCNWI